MQCTSFTPVYYHAKDVNVGVSCYSWHPYDSNASYGEERDRNLSRPPCEQYLGYGKEGMKQIIQNHEATFRYQVQELHRLHRRQRDLMDEMRMREILSHRLLSRTSESIHSPLSHAGTEFVQNHSPATNWLFGNLASSKLKSGDGQGPTHFVAENLQKPATMQTDLFVRRNSNNDVQFMSPGCKRNGNDVVNLDDQGKVFKAGSDIGSVKRWDLSNLSSNIKKTICFIDLNKPIELDSLPTTSSGPLEPFTGHNKTVCSDTFVPESIVRMKSDDGSSDGVNLSMAIDLNSMPVNSFSDTEMNLDSPRSMKRKCPEVEPVASKRIGYSFLKTETYIDLNTDVADEVSLPLSGSTLLLKSAEDTEVKGPVSPENEESSPPRGKSAFSPEQGEEQGEKETFIELDTVAAHTLVEIFSSANFKNLCWFAEFVSSTGDNLENQSEENATMFQRSWKKSKKKGNNLLNDLQIKGLLKRKQGSKAIPKLRLYSKLSSSDVTKNTMLKQGVPQRWGMTRKRRGGRSGKAIYSFSLAEMTEF